MITIFPEDKTPYDLAVAKGSIPGVTFVNKFGLNPDVDVGTEDIWSQGGLWVAPTQARVHALVSSDANDTSAGTGARTVYVEGLNSSYAVTTETVTMNGVTPVNTSNSYVIIHRMYVATAGSGGVNAGTIIATAATDATVTIAIRIGKGQSQLGVYIIPAGYTGYLTKYCASMDGSSTASVDVELFATPFGGALNLKDTVTLHGGGSTFGCISYTVPKVFAAKTTLRLRATSDTNNIHLSGNFDLYLVAI